MSDTNEENKAIYFVCKKGIYGHGVFWIGSDSEEGKKKADEFASNDKDDYHDWVLYRYIEQNDSRDDSKHRQVYIVRDENE